MKNALMGEAWKRWRLVPEVIAPQYGSHHWEYPFGHRYKARCISCGFVIKFPTTGIDGQSPDCNQIKMEEALK